MTGWIRAALAAVYLTSLAASGFAQEAEALEGAAPTALVLIESPEPNAPAWGEVVIEVEVVADAVDEVVFFVDGKEVGRVTKPPYRQLATVGDDFSGHRFEIAAFLDGKELARAVRETPGVRIDDSISLALQQLYVSVSGPDEGTVELTAGNFQVRDDGLLQKIVTFEGGDAALAVTLLVDASESMSGGRLQAALKGAHAFLDGMQELDEAAIYLFADTILRRTEFLQDAGELDPLLEGVRAAGGTALNDTLFVAQRELESRQGRRVVVLLSDGIDIHSALAIDDLLWVMRRSRSVVYWIELEPRRDDRIMSSWRTSEAHAHEREGLRRLVRESGGRVLPIDSTDEAVRAFTDILQELRRQYVLGYYPSVRRRDGRWHKVDVRIPGLNLKSRTRLGYVDF